MGSSTGPSQSNFVRTKLNKVWSKRFPSFFRWMKYTPYEKEIKSSKILNLDKTKYHAVMENREAIANFKYNLEVFDQKTHEISGYVDKVDFCPKMLGQNDPTTLDAYVSGVGSFASSAKYLGKWWCVLGILRVFSGIKLAGWNGRKTRLMDNVLILHEYSVDTTSHEILMDSAFQLSLEVFSNALANHPKVTFEEFEVDNNGKRIF